MAYLLVIPYQKFVIFLSKTPFRKKTELGIRKYRYMLNRIRVGKFEQSTRTLNLFLCSNWGEKVKKIEISEINIVLDFFPHLNTHQNERNFYQFGFSKILLSIIIIIIIILHLCSSNKSE